MVTFNLDDEGLLETLANKGFNPPHIKITGVILINEDGKEFIATKSKKDDRWILGSVDYQEV